MCTPQYSIDADNIVVNFYDDELIALKNVLVSATEAANTYEEQLNYHKLIGKIDAYITAIIKHRSGKN
jgi:hypothetical protein